MSKPLGGHALIALFGLLALLMSSGAGAVIDLDMRDKSAAVATYAKETLTTTATVKDKDNMTYYTVMSPTTGPDDTILQVQAKLGIGADDSARVFVDYMLAGMVFSAALVDASLVVVADSGDVNNPASCADSEKTVDVTKREGGAVGDNMVTFQLTGADLGSGDLMCLRTEGFAVMSNAGGGITMDVTDDVAVRPATNKAGYPNAVRVASAYTLTVKKMTATATVSTSFRSFESGQMASVGSLMANANVMYLDAAEGEAIELMDLVVPDLPDADTGAAGSSIMISGDFSFATNVSLEDTADACPSSPGTDLTMRDENGAVTDTMMLNPVAPSSLTTEQMLCVYVRAADHEDAVAILPADYMVKAVYVAGTTNAAFPPGMTNFDLGSIVRDGTTVRISYLTTFPNYNQRIVIRNRGGAAPYSLWFKTEEGATYVAGSDATGTLAANSVIYLSMMHDDVVELMGTHRVAATLLVETQPKHIDVIVSQTNNNGGTDTIEYTDN